MFNDDNIRKTIRAIDTIRSWLFGPKHGSMLAAAVFIVDTAIKIAGNKAVEGFDSEAVMYVGSKAAGMALTVWIVCEVLCVWLDIIRVILEHKLDD